MAVGLKQSPGPKVQDSQPPQACKDKLGTVGQDQMLKMDEFFVEVTERTERKRMEEKDKVPRWTKCRENSGIFKNIGV